jgi:hypothetical protein
MVISLFLRKLDLLSQPINLNFKNSAKVNSVLGGIASLLFLSLLTFLIFIEIQYEIFHSKNPHVWYFKKYSENTKLTLDSESMPLAIYLEDGEGNIFSHSEFLDLKGLKVTRQRKNSSNTNLEEYLFLEKCKTENFQKLSKEVFGKFNVSEMLCIPNQSIDIQDYENLKYYLKLNENRPSSFYDGFYKLILGKIKFKILFQKTYFNDTIVQLQHSQENVQLQEFSITIKKEVTKSIDIALRQDVYNFYDFFSTSIQSTRKILTPEIIHREESDLQDDILAEINIFPNKEIKIINVLQRNYFNFFSHIGGLGLTFYFVFQFFYSKIASFNKNLEMINSIFIFENPDSNLISQTRSKFPLVSSQKVKLFDLGSENRQTQSRNFRVNLRYMNSELEMKNMPSDEIFERVRKNSDFQMNKLDKYEGSKMEDFSNTPSPKKLTNDKFSYNNFLKGKVHSREEENPKKDHMAKFISELMIENSKNKNLKFNFIELIQAKFCSWRKDIKCAKKFSLYLKAEKELKKYLDVSYYIQKFNELESLKLLFMNSEHIAIFDYINQEKFFKCENEEKFSDTKEFFNNKENLPRIIADLKDRVENRSMKLDLDRRLYELLSDDIKRPLRNENS